VTDWERTNALRLGVWSVREDARDAAAAAAEGCQVNPNFYEQGLGLRVEGLGFRVEG
jgi:hypothetical protein